MVRKFTATTAKILLIISLVLVAPLASLAQDSTDIANDIANKQDELNKLNSELEALEGQLASSQNSRNSNLSELDQVKAEIGDLEKELEINKKKKQKLEDEIEIKGLQKQESETEQQEYLSTAYIDWKSDSSYLVKIMVESQESSIVKNALYQKILTEDMNEKILGLAAELDELEASRQDFEKTIKDLEKQSKELEERKALLNKLIEQANAAIARANSDADGIRAKKSGVQQQVEALQQQLESGGGSGNGGTQPLIAGEVYFGGTAITPDPPADVSVDAFGHGLGMSQWGAYGAGQSGWSANQILTHYYTNTAVETRSGINITVSGVGTMSADAYAAGIGEIPSKACGSVADIQAWDNFADSQGWSSSDARRNKYVLDNTSTPWDCWPEEAIKAQVIAARSYAASYGGPICTTAACQVYIGGNAKQWAAWETSNKYVISKGYTSTNQIIRAYYSAYNNNGWGTADHRTIWATSNAGNSSNDGYSYLKAVKDINFTYHYTFSRTGFIRTNSYSMEELNSMINWCSTAGNCSTYAWLRDNVKNKIGTLQSLQLEKDASGRVRRVVVNGSSGSATMSGRYFRSVFNKWIEVIKPSGELDKIPSITFTAYTAV